MQPVDVWASRPDSLTVFEDVAGLPAFRREHAPTWLTEAAIRRAIRSGHLVLVRKGVLIGRRRLEVDGVERAHALSTEIAIAALRGGSPAHACLGSAAVLQRLDRLGRPPQRVRLYRERGGPWRDADVAVLVCTLPSEHLESVQGIPTTTRARTAVDLGRWVTFKSAVVVMDSALRLGSSRKDLDAVIARCRRWPGIRNARAAAQFADGRAATPLESISRVAFRALGVPQPELQATLAWDEWGNPRIIVDFYWPEFRVVGEADGMLKYDVEPGQSDPLRAEKLRQEELEGMGYIVVRWTWDDIWRRPDWVAARLRNAFREGTRRRTA